jgi:hypothetical protein
MASANEDACGWSYGVEVSDAEWAARRKWFVDRAKNWYYGRTSAHIVSLIGILSIAASRTTES